MTSLQQKAVKKKIGCQDCGNPNCQMTDHTFTYEKSVKWSEVLLKIQELKENLQCSNCFDGLYVCKTGNKRCCDTCSSTDMASHMFVDIEKFDSVFGVKK